MRGASPNVYFGVVLLAWAGIIVFLGCAGGTRLTVLDARAEANQQRAAIAILRHVDGGPAAALAEAVYCGARGILLRAGEPDVDGGIPCR